MTISKTAVFNALKEGGKKLSLRVCLKSFLHFVTLPHILSEEQKG